MGAKKDIVTVDMVTLAKQRFTGLLKIQFQQLLGSVLEVAHQHHMDGLVEAAEMGVQVGVRVLDFDSYTTAFISIQGIRILGNLPCPGLQAPLFFP